MSNNKKLTRLIIYFTFSIFSIAFFIGAIYILYKIAVTNKKAYTIIFLTIIFIYLSYKIIKIFLDKKAIFLLYALLKFFSYIILVVTLIFAIVLPVAILLRNLGLGITIEIVSVTFLTFLLSKLKPFMKVRIFFNLN